MLQRITRAAVLIGVLLSTLIVSSHAKYPSFDRSIKTNEKYEYIPSKGSIEIDETEYCDKLLLIKDIIPEVMTYTTDKDFLVEMELDLQETLIGIDLIFKYTKYILKGNNGSMNRRINFITDCGFFELNLLLLKFNQPFMTWFVCRSINIMFNEVTSSVLRKRLVDELFKHNIVQWVVDLALSDDESFIEELAWGSTIVGTVKQETSKSVLIVIDWSNDMYIDTLVELGAFDVVCHFARTLQKPLEDKIPMVLEAASKLSSVSHRPGDETLKSKADRMKQARLCDALENYCRYYSCFDEHGKWQKAGSIAWLVFIYLFMIVGPLVAFLWLLWTSLEPVKSEKSIDTKESNGTHKQNENKCVKCDKIVPVSDMKECSKCGVAYCSRRCQKADVSYCICFQSICLHDVYLCSGTISSLPYSGQRINRCASS